MEIPTDIMLDLRQRMPAGLPTVVLAADAATTPFAAYRATWPDCEVRGPSRHGAHSLYEPRSIGLLIIDDVLRLEAELLLQRWRTRVADGGIVLLRGRAIGGEVEYVRICQLLDEQGRRWVPIFGGSLFEQTVLAHQCQPVAQVDEFAPSYPPLQLLNATPYHAMDDSFFRARLQEIIAERGIRCIVETGTNQGLATAAFAGVVEQVIGIDIDPECLRFAQNNCRVAGRDNVTLLLGSSQKVLEALLPTQQDETIYFLDAHWGEYWPLLDEIRAIAKYKPGRGVIIIHDCVSPGHDFGHDKYNGRILDYSYVQEALTAWSPTHRHEHNQQADGSRVGILYVFPS